VCVCARAFQKQCFPRSVSKSAVTWLAAGCTCAECMKSCKGYCERCLMQCRKHHCMKRWKGYCERCVTQCRKHHCFHVRASAMCTQQAYVLCGVNRSNSDCCFGTPHTCPMSRTSRLYTHTCAHTHTRAHTHTNLPGPHFVASPIAA
jgi:hypothetical protein